MPSYGSVGDGLDNAMMKSFWSSMQIELLNRRRWKTRVELANAIFDYIEIFHNRQRRHSALNYHSPIEFELLNDSIPAGRLITQSGNQPVGQVTVTSLRGSPEVSSEPMRARHNPRLSNCRLRQHSTHQRGPRHNLCTLPDSHTLSPRSEVKATWTATWGSPHYGLHDRSTNAACPSARNSLAVSVAVGVPQCN